jgi:hypothetical protein
MIRPTEAEVAAARDRLAYFEAQLSDWRAKPDDAEGKGWHVQYYTWEVGERRMLHALWEHLLGDSP